MLSTENSAKAQNIVQILIFHEHVHVPVFRKQISFFGYQ